MSRREMMVAGAGVVGVGMGVTPGLAADEKAELPGDAIILVAQIKAKAGEEEKVKTALLAMLAPTRKEPGCLRYDLHQSVKEESVFMFYEQWADLAALDAHGKTPHMAAMRQALDGKVEQAEATSYRSLNSK